MLVPAITIYAVLVWFLWGLFMGLGWALGTWIMGQLFRCAGRVESRGAKMPTI